MPIPDFAPHSVALVTGGGGGIGLSAAKRFAGAGLSIVVVDSDAGLLQGAEAALREAGAPEVMCAETDVSDLAAVEALKVAVSDRFGGVDVLMSNAGIQPGSALFGPMEAWRRVTEVNLWGVIHMVKTFGPDMVARGRPGLLINTGSKQGITTPPGDPAYNVAKAGVKAFTEALAHDLREAGAAHLSAHLMIPGFVFTQLNARGRTEAPAGAWTPDQAADFMWESLARGDFYILCPDNDVSREMDEKRIAWAAGDIIENRPALSRWHPDYGAAFAAHMDKG